MSNEFELKHWWRINGLLWKPLALMLRLVHYLCIINRITPTYLHISFVCCYLFVTLLFLLVLLYEVDGWWFKWQLISEEGFKRRSLIDMYKGKLDCKLFTLDPISFRMSNSTFTKFKIITSNTNSIFVCFPEAYVHNA